MFYLETCLPYPSPTFRYYRYAEGTIITIPHIAPTIKYQFITQFISIIDSLGKIFIHYFLNKLNKL